MWIDTHCHLNDPETFGDNLAEVVARAIEAQVQAMLVVGIDFDSSQRAVNLVDRFDALFAVVGIQPNSLGEKFDPADYEKCQQLASHPKVVAFGETGLDKYWDFAPLDRQEDYFRRHLQWCDQADKPVIIHCRDAEEETLQVLREHADQTGKPVRGVMHSFAGTLHTAQASVELGLHCSFSGMVTFKKNDALREAAASVPMDRLLVETDAPYLSPHPKRGVRPNEPALVIHTGKCLADVKGVTAEEIAQQTTSNAKKLFQLP